MKLNTPLIGLLVSGLLLSACGTTAPDQMAATDSTSSTESTTMSTSEPEKVTGSSESSGTYTSSSSYSGEASSSVVPGSQQDFMTSVPNKVFFGFDRYDLSADAVHRLDQQIEWLDRYSGVDIVIGGHADNRGTREYNLALSARRAHSVRDYLIGLGISADRITVVPYGKDRPAVLGNNEAAWAENRRAVTSIE